MKVHSGIVPGFFTMSNMFCGYLSTLQAAQGKFIPAAWLIIAAAILDTLDGKLARLTDSASDFGIQYDSLADVVSFGLAPSALAYFVFFNTWGAIGIFFSFMPLVFGSIRLARFNINAKEVKGYFQGIPSPAAATVIATFIIFNFEIWSFLKWHKVLLTLLLLVSLLMISNIRYEKMPQFSLTGEKYNRIKILIVILGTLLVILFPQEAFFPLALIYVLSGLLRSLWRILKVNPQSQLD